MNFATRKPQGLNDDRVNDVELVIQHNANTSTAIVMTWDELQNLADVIEHAIMEHEDGRKDGVVPPSERLVRDPIDDVLLA